MKVLYISSFHPNAIGNIGAGESISGDNLTTLIDQGNIVDAVILSPQRQRANAEIVKRCHSYQELPVTKPRTISAILRSVAYGSFWAPWFFTRVYPLAVELVNRRIATENYDVVWLDFPSSLGFAQLITHSNICYCAHDIVTQRIERSFSKRWLSGAVRRVESKLFSKLSNIVCLSEKDSQLCKQMGFSGHLSVLELGSQKVGIVDSAVDIQTVVSQFDNNVNLVFFGNMMRPENHWSVIWFILRALPRRTAKNEVHFWVLGLSPKFLLRFIGKLYKNVHIVGAVDDPTPAFRQADLCLAPLLFGAGVKIKVLQMLDADARVLATPVGAEGVRHDERLVVVNSRNYKEKLIEMIDK